MDTHGHNEREKNIKVALFLNILFVIIEIIGGLWTNSLAILSDALHDFGDSIALATSLVAEKKAKKPADLKRTYGYQRLSLFAALFAGVVLVTGSLFIIAQAIPRLINPEHSNATGMIGIAIVGIFINGLGVWRLKRGQSQDEKVLSWHLLEDVLGWCTILIAGIIIFFWDSHIIDPIITLGFTIFILWGVVRNLKGTFNIFMQGVPEHIDLEKIDNALLQLEGVQRIHDVHVWSLEGETDVFSGHIVIEKQALQNQNNLKEKIKQVLADYHIEHSTIELEDEANCSGVECDTKEFGGDRVG